VIRTPGVARGIVRCGPEGTLLPGAEDGEGAERLVDGRALELVSKVGVESAGADQAAAKGEEAGVDVAASFVAGG
jgi:hypothetical protein